MLSQDIIVAIAGIARNEGIEPAALLAVVEVETSGRAFEPDGVTPRFLFEKHVFWRELAKISAQKLSDAAQQGLATEKWMRDYSDQKTSADRLSLLQRARAIDPEAANRSASWGLGQVLGRNATSLGYPSATAMVDALSRGGIAAHIESMMRFITTNNLIRALKAQDWVTFALGYNGAQQARNGYATKLQQAYQRWRNVPLPSVALAQLPGAVTRNILQIGDSGDDVRRMQAALAAKNYPVGGVDGEFGPLTQKAVFLFQRANNLMPSGIVDAATSAKLATGIQLPVSDARKSATLDTLRQAGSETIRRTDRGRLLAGLLSGTGAVGLLESFFGGANNAGPFGAIMKVALGAMGETSVLAPLAKVVPVLLGPGHGLPVVAAGLGVMLWRSFSSVAARRLEDHASGMNRIR